MFWEPHGLIAIIGFVFEKPFFAKSISMFIHLL